MFSTHVNCLQDFFADLLFPELPLEMCVTEGSDCGDTGVTQDPHGSDTVKGEMLTSGSQSGTGGQRHTGTQGVETKFLTFQVTLSL